MTECMITARGGGAKPYGTLSEQIENFTVTAGDLSAVLKWTLPPSAMFDPHFVRVDIVRKVGSAPTKYSDGDVVYSGSGTTYTDTGLTAGTTYYYRAFAVNADGEIQTAERIVSTTARTVTIWEKWSSAREPVYRMELFPQDWYDISGDYYTDSSIYMGTGYSFDEKTGEFTISGEKQYYFSSSSSPSFAPSNAAGKYLEVGRNDKVDGESVYIELVALTELIQRAYGHWCAAGPCYYAREGSEFVKGKTSYGTVSSIDPNAYPTNGRHTDGYWYIRK